MALSSAMFFFGAIFLLGIQLGACRLQCYSCVTSALNSDLRQDCLESKVELLQCGYRDKYCVMLRYTETMDNGDSKVVLRRGCSREFIGNFCQQRTLNDGTLTDVCVSTCTESRCNNLPSTVDMNGYMHDYFGRR